MKWRSQMAAALKGKTYLMICFRTARNLLLMQQEKSLWICVSSLWSRDYGLRFLTPWFLSYFTAYIKHKCYLVSEEITHGKLIWKDRLVFSSPGFFLQFSWEDKQRDRAPSPRLKKIFPEYKPDCLFLFLLDSMFSLLANFVAKDTEIRNSDSVYNETKEQK